MPSRHRTTARSILALLFLWASAGTANAAVPRLDFPVVGVTSYTNDYGDARSGGRSHEGNDIMARRWTPVVAVESGRVYRPSWSSSDCVLILEGRSGTHYWYLHLNNDRTRSNDNSGGCKNGISFAPTIPTKRDVEKRVYSGQLIGYLGDSGNADGTPHLHFEVHPNGGKPTNPYTHLNRARRLLFPVPAYPAAFQVAMTGRFRKASGGVLEMAASRVRVPYIRWTAIRPRVITFLYGDDLTVQRRRGSTVRAARLRRAREGEKVAAWTGYVAQPVKAQRNYRNIMVLRKIELRGG